jgi:putative spermidine/putrescine transport system ATP-binding protein
MTPQPSADTRPPAVALRGLELRYGDVTAVDGIDLEIAEGEAVTFLGPSGSGKTSTLMMIAGHTAPTGGEIFVGGSPASKVPAHKRNLGMVFQNLALFPHLTAAQNVAYPLKLRRVPAKEAAKKVAAMLEMVGLPHAGDRRPAQLSGGQQQRIALARALVFGPRMLLMDEPLGALDKNLRQQMEFEIKRIQRELGISLVYVTHDQEEALTLSDRIVIMRDGGIVQQGAPDDLYAAPKSIFVAQFLGDANIVKGTVQAASDDSVVVKTDWGVVVRAVGSPGLSAGETAWLNVRPEQIGFESPDSPHASRGEGANRVEGRVLDLLYLGETTKYRIAVPGDIVTVKDPNIGTAARPMPDDDVTLVWDPAQTRQVSNDV